MNLLNKLADNRKSGSYADKLRKKRFLFLKNLMRQLPKPLRIIDVGGTQLYWERMGVHNNDEVLITVLNLKQEYAKYPNINSVAGDARNMQQFDYGSFDVAFSNSVIEHVGSFTDQVAMASEMKRIASRIYLQTPNKYFPLEPHFLFPFFQFLPMKIKISLLMNFKLGWYPKFIKKSEAQKAAGSIRLLSKKELKKLFPEAKIHTERVFGLVKSYIIIQGW